MNDRVRGAMLGEASCLTARPGASAEASRLSAIGRAERAARDMVEAFHDAFESVKEVRVAAGAMPKPIDLSASEMGRRLSYRLSDLLKKITHPVRFGAIALALGPFRSDETWTDGERRAAQDIARIITKEKT